MATATLTSSYALSLTPTSLPLGSPVASETLSFTGNGFAGVPSGSLYSAVYNVSGKYTFVYQLTDTGASSITELTLNGFIPSVGVTTLGYVTGNTDPKTATLLGSGNLQVGFDTSGNGIGIPASGGLSDYLVVATTATAYLNNFPAGVIDGGVAPANAYGPTVPDGGMTIMLLGGALSGMALLRRKLA